MVHDRNSKVLNVAQRFKLALTLLRRILPILLLYIRSFPKCWHLSLGYLVLLVQSTWWFPREQFVYNFIIFTQMTCSMQRRNCDCKMYFFPTFKIHFILNFIIRYKLWTFSASWTLFLNRTKKTRDFFLSFSVVIDCIYRLAWHFTRLYRKIANSFALIGQ